MDESIDAWKMLTRHWVKLASVTALGSLATGDASVLQGAVRPRGGPAPAGVTGATGAAGAAGAQAAQSVLASSAELGHSTLEGKGAGLRSMVEMGREHRGEYERRIEARVRSLETLEQRISAAELAVRVSQQASDESWLLVSSTLVLMMTISGLALFYGGLVRVQNVLATVMQSFAIACLISVLWIAVGYSLCFTEGSPVYGSYTRFWLTGMKLEGHNPLNTAVSEPIFCMYELTFAIITPALISGAFADRMRFGPMLIFIALWHLLVYCPVAHATWMTDGFLHKAGVLDFAGGNVVHIIAGFSGLVSSIVIGKRAGYGHEQFSAHNMLISVLGASLLWVGWMGFNGGSAGESSPRASIAILNTNIAAATSSVSWMCIEWTLKGRPSVLGMISGAIAGLVCITPGAGFVNITGGFVFGLLAAPCGYFSAQLKTRFGFDDALDAFGIHAPGGVLGGILVAFFAEESIAGLDSHGVGINGIFYGDSGWRLLIQIYGIAVSIGWCVVMTYIILKVLDKVVGVRVKLEDELIGLDMVVHGTAIWGVDPVNSYMDNTVVSAGQLSEGTIKQWMDATPLNEEEEDVINMDLLPKETDKDEDPSTHGIGLYQGPNIPPVARVASISRFPSF